MNVTVNGVDISTEGRFLGYINSLNEEIMEQNAKGDVKKELQYNVGYLLRRYRYIMAKNKMAEFMAENECMKCVFYQRLARKCNANHECLLEKIGDSEVYTRIYHRRKYLWKGSLLYKMYVLHEQL